MVIEISATRPHRVLAFLFALVAMACGGKTDLGDDASDSGTSSALASSGLVGTPCTPSVELDPAFSGFAEGEVFVEVLRGASLVCVANHFRGRTTCPYGSGVSSCDGPNGKPLPKTTVVQPGCTDRTRGKAVHYSCRCDGPGAAGHSSAEFCTCPAGMECTPLVSSIGSAGLDVAGSYCAWPPAKATEVCEVDCDLSIRNCGEP